MAPIILLSDDQAPSRTADRRRRERVSGDAPGWILPAMLILAKHSPDGDEAWEVRVKNVSRYGVGFTSTELMHIGDQHRMRIGRGPLKRSRLIQIVACELLAEGGYHIGAKFTDLPVRVLSKAG